MRILYRRRALADLESIHRHISKDNPIAARRVISRIQRSLGRLENFPFSGRPGAKAGTRELTVPGLPYLVIYKVIPRIEANFVEVVAVYHTARRRSLDES